MNTNEHTIKNYRIEKCLAEGGMGKLYLGFDTKLEREVVLKSIGLEGEHVLAKKRFLREAHALSKLDHPNICRIYEYVEGEDQDFLVLERIHGITLDEAIQGGCEYKKKLDWAIQIADALHFAHKSGFVHRDLKPSNIMISRENQVKVLDFGLAFRSKERKQSALQIDLDHTLPDEGILLDPFHNWHNQSPSTEQTLQGSLVGTLIGMSPEQANGIRATTASDMYSYGLLLQVLFTEKPCYEENLAFPALLFKVAHGDTIPITNLKSDLKALINKLKNLRPEDRPTSKEALEQLHFIKKRPAKQLRFALSLMILLFVISVISKFVIDLDRAHKQSELARIEAEQVTNFMLEVFKVSDPNETLGAKVTVREMLQLSSRRLKANQELPPVTKSRMMLAIAKVYKNLGLYEAGEDMYRNALSVSKGIPAKSPLIVAEAEFGLGSLLSNMGHYDESLDHLNKALEIRETELGSNHPEVANVLSRVGALLWDQNKFVESQAFMERAFKIREESLAPSHLDLAQSYSQLGLVFRRLGASKQAETYYRRSIKILEANGGLEHPDLIMPLNNLGVALRTQNRYTEAESIYKRVIEIQEKIYDHNNPTLATTQNNLALLLWRIGQYSEASEYALKALRTREAVFGSNHIKTAYPKNALGQIRWKQGRFKEAESLLEEALCIWESNLGWDNLLLAWPLSGLAGIRRDQGQYEESEALFRRALLVRTKSLPQDHPDLVHLKHEFAILLRQMDRHEEAASIEPAPSLLKTF